MMFDMTSPSLQIIRVSHMLYQDFQIWSFIVTDHCLGGCRVCGTCLSFRSTKDKACSVAGTTSFALHGLCQGADLKIVNCCGEGEKGLLVKEYKNKLPVKMEGSIHGVLQITSCFFGTFVCSFCFNLFISFLFSSDLTNEYGRGGFLNHGDIMG